MRGTIIQSMKQPVDRLVLILCCLALLCNIGTWAVLLWKIPHTNETIFLHYNIYFGIDLTGSWRQLFWVPGTGSVIFLVNSAVIFFSRQLARVTKIAFSILTLAFQLMLAVASVLIILLNA